MELKLLEDFVCLAHTKNFSKSADIRHVTQPAFSRRIKSLENWFGVPLIDRSHYPILLTQEGKRVYEIANKLIDEMHLCRDEVRSGKGDSSLTLKFAMPHNLSISFFPEWHRLIEDATGPVELSVVTGNIHDSAQLLDSDSCDFVIFFNFEFIASYSFNNDDFLKLRIGKDKLIPVCATKQSGSCIYTLDVNSGETVPYLAWGKPTLAHHVVSELLKHKKLEQKIKVKYQNQLAAALREEALLGGGIAWLPEQLVKNDLSENKLAIVDENHIAPFEIFIVRKYQNSNPLVEKWWKYTRENLCV